MYIEVPSLEFEELRERPNAESSAVIRARVNEARRKQQGRYEGTGTECNAYIGSKLLDKYCALDKDCEKLMKDAYDRLGLTARSYDRILRVARTIADLASSEGIERKHLAEAIQYRTYDFRDEG
jgi:magnesium chelatase family protein